MKQLLLLLLLIPSILFSQDDCGQFVIKTEKEMVSDGYSTRQKSTECNLFKAVVHVINLGEPIGTGTNPSDEQIMSSETSTNLSWTNSGHKYHPDNTPFPYELEISAITRTNGAAVFGNTWVQYGVDAGVDENGITPTTIRNYLNSNYDYPTDEYIPIILYNKRNGNNSTLGFAWVASPEIGVFVRYDHIGDDFYETDTPFIGNPDNSIFLHEVYHGFGLFHTFNNTTSCQETNCNIQNDRVCDTEVETVSWICGNICGHNSRNVMSYKSCKDVITQGQVDRMNGIINFPPNGILDMLYCPPQEPEEPEGDMFPIITGFDSKCEKSEVGISWSAQNEDSVSHYNIIAAYGETEIIVGTVPAGQGAYTFYYDFEINHTVYIEAVLFNGQTDIDVKSEIECGWGGCDLIIRNGYIYSPIGAEIVAIVPLYVTSVTISNGNLSPGLYVVILNNGCKIKIYIS